MARLYPHPIIAREGWPFIIGSVVLSVVVTALACWWSLPFWLLTVFVVQFFRDPAREIPNDPEAVLSPADGRIVVVEQTTDPYRGVNALKISVFMNVFNVHSNRSPIDGVVERVDYFKGSFLNAALDKASVQNERNAVLAVTNSGRPVTFVQVAGLVARRILCYVHSNDRIWRGERYGFIRFGSRVDVYLPDDAVPRVAIGDKVSASSTVLAMLPLQRASVPLQQTGDAVGAAADADVVAEVAESEVAGVELIEKAADKVQEAVKQVGAGDPR